VIAHISQASAATHEGWGSPGTQWEGVHYRTFILSTVPEMRECNRRGLAVAKLQNHPLCFPFSLYALTPGDILCPTAGGPPLSTASLVAAAEALSPPSVPGKPDPLRVFVASYAAIVDRARFARAEPSQADAEVVEKVVALVRNLVEVKREREKV